MSARQGAQALRQTQVQLVPRPDRDDVGAQRTADGGQVPNQEEKQKEKEKVAEKFFEDAADDRHKIM